MPGSSIEEEVRERRAKGTLYLKRAGGLTTASSQNELGWLEDNNSSLLSAEGASSLSARSSGRRVWTGVIISFGISARACRTGEGRKQDIGDDCVTCAAASVSDPAWEGCRNIKTTPSVTESTCKVSEPGCPSKAFVSMTDFFIGSSLSSASEGSRAAKRVCLSGDPTSDMCSCGSPKDGGLALSVFDVCPSDVLGI